MANETSLRELVEEIADAARLLAEATEQRRLSGMYFAAKRLNRAAASIAAKLRHVEDTELSAFARAEVDRALRPEET